MKITVLRWPIKTDTGGARAKRVITRTAKPTAEFSCEGHRGARGLVAVTFPGLMGSWEFRLSTGFPVSSKIADYMIPEESLLALRALQEPR